MPTTRKLKKARKSREQDLQYEIENPDIMLGRDSLDRQESISSNLCKRPESPSYRNFLDQNGQSHSYSREAEIRSYAQNGHSAREVFSSR